MKNFFGEFLESIPQSVPASRGNLGQTQADTGTSYKSYIFWMLISGTASAFLSWRACSWYHHYRQLVKKSSKASEEKALKKKNK